MPELSIVEAVNFALREEMRRDERVVVLGEDVGALGGVFRATDGLLEEFGEDRVLDTPLAEGGIIGSAVGMALYGLKPVAEIQFSGFVYQGFHMIEQHMARFRNRTVGFVFQEHHLLPQYSVLENVLLPTLAFPGDRQDSAGRARELLERVGLSHRLEHRPAELSGGERQRVVVARALINRPGLMLCDEPTGSLDQAAADAVASLLFEMHGGEGNVMICVTHSLSLAARFERRFELRDGQCVEP